MPQLTIVHRKPLSVDYLAPWFSSANLWRLFTYPAIAILTLLLTFATQGLWRRTNVYLEQPIVDFRDKLFFIFHHQDGHTKYFWSPFEEFNEKWSDRLMIPVMAMSLRDFDGDQIPDEVSIRGVFRPADADFDIGNISSIFYALFFNVHLERRVLIEIESSPVYGLIHMQHVPHSFNELNLIGALNFVQLRPLPWHGNLTIPEWSPSIGHFINESDGDLCAQLDELTWQLQQYESNMNYTIGIERSVEHWKLRSIDAANSTQSKGLFHFAMEGRIREQILHYRTNGWEMLKWAWIQFLAIFVIIHALFNALSSFLYQNQILGTVVIGQRGEEKFE